ncbi:MAG: hypothetical protein R6V57_18865 [Vicinamibacterales bacterium]
MDCEFTERRSSPRASTESTALGALHVSVPVRLLDIGSDGLLMASWVPLRVGSTLKVVAAFAGRRLEVELIVRHASGGWDERAGGYVVGGSFPSFDATARQIITALLGASGLCAAAETVPLAARGRSEAPVHAGVRRERSARRSRERRPETPRPDQPTWSVPAS